jgi:hypothetical protein
MHSAQDRVRLLAPFREIVINRSCLQSVIYSVLCTIAVGLLSPGSPRFFTAGEIARRVVNLLLRILGFKFGLRQQVVE